MEENQTQEQFRGERGEVGVATAACTIKRLHFVEQGGKGSLKQFARKLSRDKENPNSAVAKEWLANKKGAKNQKRTDANIALARTCANATHLERRKAKNK
jgi:hypothetical protein